MLTFQYPQSDTSLATLATVSPASDLADLSSVWRSFIRQVEDDVSLLGLDDRDLRSSRASSTTTASSTTPGPGR